jgi:hypothetical protein
MQRQVVRTRESSIAEFAMERLVPGVLALVPRQLVRAGKPPAAVLPRADVGLLPGVRAQVGLQVRGLGVGLPAPGLVAYVQRRRFALQDNHNLLLLLLLLQVVVGMGMEGRGQGRG